MTTPIVRLYETEQKARDAVGKLAEEGFPKETIFLVKPTFERDAGTADDLAVAAMAGFVPQDQVAVYAEGLKQGRSVVAIRAPFGQGALATHILDSCGPMETGLELPKGRPIAWEVGAPLSSAFLLPIILRNKPAPFSGTFGLPMLSSGRTFGSKYKELASSDYAFFGRSRLSQKAAPLSSLFGLKTLSTKARTSRTSSFGLPLLSQNAAPLSSKLGMHLLTGRLPPHEPAPFSAHLGLPTLSPGRSFLSRIFGELGSPNFALFGRSRLSQKAAPLSSLFGLATISDKSGPSWTSSFGLPLLSERSRPFNLGVPLTARNPAPLSSLLGLPLLTKYQ